MTTSDKLREIAEKHKFGYHMNGILCMAKIDFECPFCHKQYKDDNDKYCDRINKSKKFYTTVKCSCGKSFKLTANYKSELVTFV